MSLNDLDQDATFEYLTALNENVAEYTASGSAPVEAVAAGTATVGVVFAHDCVAAIADGARDLVLSFPKEGTGSEIGATAVIKGGPDARGRKEVDRLGADREGAGDRPDAPAPTSSRSIRRPRRRSSRSISTRSSSLTTTSSRPESNGKH